MNLMEYALTAWEGREESRMCTFLRGEEVTTRSFQEEMAEAKAMATEYRARGVRAGDVVVIILRYRIELMAAFLGALWMGAIPSFLPEPSEKQDLNYYWKSSGQLLQRLAAKLLVTDMRVATQLGSLPTQIWNIDESESSARRTRKEEGNVTLQPAPAGSIAFLQHSSGTTALKKSVALTHGQVLAQARSYQKALGMQAGERVGSWLPLYHDMGLIACFILPMLCGAQVVMMSPFAWVRRPWMLLDALETHGCDYCWLPNFAFHLLALAKPDGKEWRLGGVKAFINCSEPCKADAFRKFTAAFSASGVSAKQLQVCYAMAETVFAVTQTKLGEEVVPLRIDGDEFTANRRAVRPGSGGVATLLPVGEEIEGMRVRIFDEEGKPVREEGIVGEIGVTGTALFQGYYAFAEETARRRVGEWHLTGDLGFIYAGQLYVTGRKGDIINVRGKKFHAFDIETIVSSVPGIKAGRAVAFAVDNEECGSEEAVVVAEIAAHGESPVSTTLCAEVRKAVFEGLGLMLGEIYLAPERWIIKTTSGKVSRHLNAEKYKAAKLIHV